MNLYEDHKTAWDALAKAGKPALGEMAKRFKRATEMDAALGLNNAAAHWASGRNGASMPSERAAAVWLERANKPAPAPSNAPPFGALLLVACPPGADAKVARVLALLGCEVIE